MLFHKIKTFCTNTKFNQQMNSYVSNNHYNKLVRMKTKILTFTLSVKRTTKGSSVKMMRFQISLPDKGGPSSITNYIKLK